VEHVAVAESLESLLAAEPEDQDLARVSESERVQAVVNFPG
jgi:hypothetical protein